MPTKKAWRLLIKAGYTLIILVLGVLIGKTIQRWPILKIKTEVDTIGAFFSVASILVTLSAAYWVATVLESRKEASRAEKDLLIRRIDSVYDLIDETSLKVSSQEIDLTYANANIKRISRNTLAIIDALSTHTAINIPNTHKIQFIASIGELKDLLTNTPRISEEHLSQLPLEVREGIIHMSTDRRLAIDSKFDEIKGVIFKLELAINKG